MNKRRNRMYRYTKPRKIAIDASTMCQLKCLSCPHADGTISQKVSTGFLRFNNFKKIVDKNPSVSRIGLSNWGEIFLNPELKQIIEYGYTKNVILAADANLNTIDDDVLEALVKYQFYDLSCSIDGASQETYSIYRVGGDYNRVIENIKKINYYKRQYRSHYPTLQWQFIPFGHNEHEIATAREIAATLNMRFSVKLSWDDLYVSNVSPVKNKELIRKESGLGVADRQEFVKKYGKNYIDGCCHGIFLNPQINYDGRLLGCCVNYWGSFGNENIFVEGLERCFNNETINYARLMLLGLKEGKEDIPCAHCKIYEFRKKNNSWVQLKDLDYYVKSRMRVMLRNKIIRKVKMFKNKIFTHV